MFRKPLITILICAFLATSVMPVPRASAALSLPEPGTMVNLSPAFEPVLIKGLKVHPENPFAFDFIVDTGSEHFPGDLSSRNSGIRDQAGKLIKYFLASLTIPEKDLWVNLSPYEKDRMISPNLGQTQMGEDMLAEDYILKQLTASLIYPEKDLGKTFWDKVYQKAQALYGTTEIPVNTFNKVWIVADKADVFERGNTAYIVGAHLKVMLEEDYTALAKHQTPTRPAFGGASPLPTPQPMNLKAPQGNYPNAVPATNTLASDIVRQVILPAIEQEVNQGKNFTALRQMFYSMILASWYKMALKDALLTQIYGNQSKTAVGINTTDPAQKDKIFEQYLKAYKKGVFNYIKEDVNTVSKQPRPRKYFSGGFDMAMLGKGEVLHRHQPWNDKAMTGSIFQVSGGANMHRPGVNGAEDSAMTVVQGRLFMPTTDYRMGKGPLDFNLVRSHVTRSAGEVLDILRRAREAGVYSSGSSPPVKAGVSILSISGYLRGLDGAGSSLDLPEFQIRLTPQGVSSFDDLPSTVTIASDQKATVTFELADDPDVIEYVASDYGIDEDKPYIIRDEQILTKDGRLKKGQVDAVAYIFRDVFGLRGIRVKMEGISAIALAGGMESSNMFNVALITAASILSGADLSYADIVALAVKLENDEFGGLTGGQGHWSTVLGSAKRLVWLSGIPGNTYGVVAQDVLTDEQMRQIENHVYLVQAGKPYKDGKAVTSRTASLTNNMWTDLLRDDPWGQALHQRKIALTARYAQALKDGDFKEIARILNEYVDIRDAISRRWINLMLDARQDKADVPGYARNYAAKVFTPKNAEEEKDYEVVRTLFENLPEPIFRQVSLYSMDDPNIFIQKVRELGDQFDINDTFIQRARKADLAVFPLGAGGFGGNTMLVSPDGDGAAQAFFAQEHLGLIRDEQARVIIRGTGNLKGYLPFRVGREGLQVNGFDHLTDKQEHPLTIPQAPAATEVPASSVGMKSPVAATFTQKEAQKVAGADAAMMAKAPGGIDLNRANMQMNVRKEDNGVQIQFDPAMIERIKRDGFDGLEFQIQQIIPVTNLSMLLGFKEDEQQNQQLAGV